MVAPLTLNGQGRFVSDGWLTVLYGSPWPGPNGTRGGLRWPCFGSMHHTEVGYEHTVDHDFDTAGNQAGSHVAVSGGFGGDIADGVCRQFGPVGGAPLNFMSWAQVMDNPNYVSIENEDGGDPTRPMTQLQILANAALAECVSFYAGTPLAICDHGQRGITPHSHPDGSIDSADGGHACPGPVRLQQLKTAVVAWAQHIRILRGAPISEADMLTMHYVDTKDGSVGFTDVTGTLQTFDRQGQAGGHFLGNLINHPAYNAGAGKANGPVVGITPCDDGLQPFCGYVIWTQDAAGTLHPYVFPSDGRHKGQDQ